VVWKEPQLAGRQTVDIWPSLGEKFRADRSALDDACQAILEGPMVCELGILWSGELINTNLAAFKHLNFALTWRMLWELHQGNRDAAWTNLMAVTRLNTAWQTEPVELSRMARMANMMTAELATWEAMQYKSWTDSQLASLQHEWESLNLFEDLDETAAVAGANAVMMCRLAREASSNSVALRLTASEALRSPHDEWRSMVSNYREMIWRNRGSYEYENALMLYFKAREGELKRAIGAASWLEMRSLPGVTSAPPLPSNPHSMMLPLGLENPSGEKSLMSTLLGRSAACETKRRLLITAIALERHHLHVDSYPGSLSELRPKFLAVEPMDFMDARPLRYTAVNGSFILYSVGLDCVDQGGDMTRVKHWHEENGVSQYSLGPENDLVWPRPASPGEMEND
jgi:hypothetical protein